MQELPVFFHISGIPYYVTYSWIATLILLGITFFARRSLNLVPRGVQNVVEIIIELLLNFSKKTIGPMGGFFFPFLATIAFYVFVCNILGIIPGFEAPTSNLNTNAAIAVPVFLATHYYGVRTHGLGYLKHFVGPIRSLAALPLMALMFVIEVIAHLSRPLTLSVRLFGNMMAKHKLLVILVGLSPWFIPIPILGLGVLVSVVQTAVFVLLSALYLAGAVEEAH